MLLHCRPERVGLPDAAQHRRKVRGSPRGALRAPFAAGSRAPARTPDDLVPGRLVAPDDAPPERPQSVCAASLPLALDPAGPDPRRPDERPYQAGCQLPLDASRTTGPPRPAGRPVGAVARLRDGRATSAGGIVIRHEAGIPQFVAGRRRREGSGFTWTLPKGTPESRRDDRADGPARGERGDRPRGPDHRPPRFDLVPVRPEGRPDPQDRSLFPDGADRRRPGPARP